MGQCSAVELLAHDVHAPKFARHFDAGFRYHAIVSRVRHRLRTRTVLVVEASEIARFEVYLR